MISALKILAVAALWYIKLFMFHCFLQQAHCLSTRFVKLKFR